MRAKSYLSKMGWYDETVRVPPDNAEIIAWSFYGPPILWKEVGDNRTQYINNVICMVCGDGRTFMVQAVGAEDPKFAGRRRPMRCDVRISNSTVEDAKREAEDLLRDLGWDLATVSGAPDQGAAARGVT